MQYTIKHTPKNLTKTPPPLPPKQTVDYFSSSMSFVLLNNTYSQSGHLMTCITNQDIWCHVLPVRTFGVMHYQSDIWCRALPIRTCGVMCYQSGHVVSCITNQDMWCHVVYYGASVGQW